jgi:hypothetical protein
VVASLSADYSATMLNLFTWYVNFLFVNVRSGLLIIFRSGLLIIFRSRLWQFRYLPNHSQQPMLATSYRLFLVLINHSLASF